MAILESLAILLGINAILTRNPPDYLENDDDVPESVLCGSCMRMRSAWVNCPCSYASWHPDHDPRQIVIAFKVVSKFNPRFTICRGFANRTDAINYIETTYGHMADRYSVVPDKGDKYV